MEHLDLARFSPTNKQEWLQLAQQQLKGVDPIEKLQWHPHPEIGAQPYYDEGDTRELGYLTTFFLECPKHSWKLYQRVSENETDLANQKALEALAGGCDGIIFDLERSITSSELLKGIITDICDISIVNGAESLEAFGAGFDLRNPTDSLIVKQEELEIEQISQIVNEYNQQSHLVRQASTDFFFEIACLRAIRYLLYQHHDIDPWNIHFHTFIPINNAQDQQWFLNTTGSLASILGGSNSVSFQASDGMDRISRNVGNLIREESGIVQYEDQCGGSYFVESLTHQIIETVNKKLNEK